MACTAARKAAGSLADDQTGITLTNVTWSGPIVAEVPAPTVNIVLIPEENGQIAYEIYTDIDNNDKESIIHGQGVASFKPIAKRPNLDIASLQNTMNQGHFSSKDCYDAFKKRGIVYGPGYRGLSAVYIGTNRVLAKLSLPFSVLESRDEYTLHPSLMESALQASIGLIFKSNANAFSDFGMLPSGTPSLLFSVHELEILGTYSSVVWALIVYKYDMEKKDTAPAFDIDLFEETGRIWVKIKGLSYRKGGRTTYFTTFFRRTNEKWIE